MHTVFFGDSDKVNLKRIKQRMRLLAKGAPEDFTFQ